MEDIVENENSLPKAKNISKIFKFIAPLFVVVCSVCKWVGWFGNGDVNEFMKVGAFIYAAGAGTIDINLIIKNIRGLE